jgi:uncharacterized iron-regulated protein
MKKTLFLLASIALVAFSADKPAYKLYTAAGKETEYEKLLKEALRADVVLFGELHNNPICHWLQLELTRDLFAQKGSNLRLGAEMFESDDQLVMDEYLAGKMTDKTFKDEAKLWTNYNTDYKPLIDFAKKNKVPFIASNIPRRYANLVYSSGIKALDSLHEDGKKYIAPLPFPYDPELKCYKEIFEAAEGHGGDNLPKSQAIKDASMAHFILKNIQSGQTMLHFNGAYHSNNFQGIIWYLNHYRPNIKVLAISSVEQDTIKELDAVNKNLADFTIVIPSGMTKTY